VGNRPAADTSARPAEEIERSIGLTRQGRSRVQLALTLLGYSTGGTDGVLGTKSRSAISAWQTDRGETATGFLTTKQHAALLDAAAPKLVAWDAEQKRKAAEAQAKQQQAAADAAKQQQYQPQYQQQYQQTGSATVTTTASQSTQASQAAAQAEAERMRQENEQLKKQTEAQEDRQNVQIGVSLFNTVVGGALPLVQ